MQMIPRTLLKPLPIAGISGLVLAATLATTRRPFSTTTPPPPTNMPYKITPYTPSHTTWPYTPSDFRRQDESPDTSFYSSPRFVTHIDDAAIQSLREYYATVLPTKKGKILDFCSSWVSHFPREVEEAVANGDGSLKVIGMGMNKAELEANAILTGGRILRDLNVDPDIYDALLSENCIIEEESDKLDASTNVVSTDYLTKPLETLKSLREATKTGGTVHLTISNRCFPTKAVGRWLRVSEEERLEMIGTYLFFAGWKRIEVVELSDGTVKSGEGGLLGMIGMGRRDPLWVVRAVKE